MLERIQKKITYIQSQPEAVRLRYVFVYLAVSMAFIVVIWLFSVMEGLRSFSSNRAVLPAAEGEQSTGASLQDLLNEKSTLDVQEEKNAEEYLNEQMKVMQGEEQAPASETLPVR